MALKDIEIRAAKGAEKPYKLYDGLGLYLLVNARGSKHWKMRYSHGGKERKLSFGRYPELSLKDARARRDEARTVIASGNDPSIAKRKAKIAAAISVANTFELVAKDYIQTKMTAESAAPATIAKAQWFLSLLKPAIGNMPIADVDPQMLLAPLKKLEALALGDMRNDVDMIPFASISIVVFPHPNGGKWQSHFRQIVTSIFQKAAGCACRPGSRDTGAFPVYCNEAIEWQVDHPRPFDC